jgi:hypothetical protein
MHRPTPRPRWWLPRLLVDLTCQYNHIINKLEELMASQQEIADALAARIDTSTGAIRQDIADLKAAHPEVDFSKLEASVGGLEGLDAENPVAEPPTE